MTELFSMKAPKRRGKARINILVPEQYNILIKTILRVQTQV